MKIISEISSDPKQVLDVVTEDNQIFELKLEFSDQQQGWFYSINFDDTVIINGSRIITGPNILRAFKEILPFGIAIGTNDKTEPFLIDDFTSERVTMFLLTAEEVDQVESDFYNL